MITIPKNLEISGIAQLVPQGGEFLFGSLAGHLEIQGVRTQIHAAWPKQFSRFAEENPASPRAHEALFRAGENYSLIDSLARASETFLALILQYPWYAEIIAQDFEEAPVVKKPETEKKKEEIKLDFSLFRTYIINVTERFTNKPRREK